MNTDLNAQQESFKTEVREWIQQVTGEFQKDITKRISEMLEVFKNETAQIEQRTHRLAKFSSIKEIKLGENSRGIKAGNNANFWIFQINENAVAESDIENFNDYCKKAAAKISKKVLIALNGMNINAKILAKESKLWIWDLQSLNELMEFYKRPKVIIRKNDTAVKKD